MNDHIRALLNQITALENDLQTALQEQLSSMFFQIKGKRIEFEGSIKQVPLPRAVTAADCSGLGPFARIACEAANAAAVEAVRGSAK